MNDEYTFIIIIFYILTIVEHPENLRNLEVLKNQNYYFSLFMSMKLNINSNLHERKVYKLKRK